MNKLYFRYATMGAGKSLDLLKTAHNYEERNKRVFLLTSSLDDRFGKKKIASRLGISKKADTFNKDTDIYELIYHKNQVINSLNQKSVNDKKLSCVLIDESQFLTKAQVWQLTDVVDYLNIDVICYGLRSDYQGEPFEGSTYLMTLSDEIEELKTICEYGDKTSMNMRMLDGKPIFRGSQIHIAADDSYTPVCRKHFKKERHKKTFIENE
tara:strand:+ start:2463 stop:3092 length:630 start_codon:yes stop_codon:yes gene_type:complete